MVMRLGPLMAAAWVCVGLVCAGGLRATDRVDFPAADRLHARSNAAFVVAWCVLGGPACVPITLAVTGMFKDGIENPFTPHFWCADMPPWDRAMAQPDGCPPPGFFQSDVIESVNSDANPSTTLTSEQADPPVAPILPDAISSLLPNLTISPPGGVYLPTSDCPFGTGPGGECWTNGRVEAHSPAPNDMHLLTQTVGGAMQLIGNLTAHECEVMRAWALGLPATDAEKAAQAARHAPADSRPVLHCEDFGLEKGCAVQGFTSGQDGPDAMPSRVSDIKFAECFK